MASLFLTLAAAASASLMCGPSMPIGRCNLHVAMSMSAAAKDVAPPSSSDLVAGMDEEAIALDAAAKPVRGTDGRLQPTLTLPGDTLATTPVMVGVTAASTALTVGVVGRAFAMSALPVFPLLAVLLGVLAGELFSGAFHWATDNYGKLETPVVGFACAAFQGHNLAPWTISFR